METEESEIGWEEIDWALVEFSDFESLKEFVSENLILDYKPSIDLDMDMIGTFYVGTYKSNIGYDNYA
jgi:hypothetical protein